MRTWSSEGFSWPFIYCMTLAVLSFEADTLDKDIWRRTFALKTVKNTRWSPLPLRLTALNTHLNRVQLCHLPSWDLCGIWDWSQCFPTLTLLLQFHANQDPFSPILTAWGNPGHLNPADEALTLLLSLLQNCVCSSKVSSTFTEALNFNKWMFSQYLRKNNIAWPLNSRKAATEIPVLTVERSNDLGWNESGRFRRLSTLYHNVRDPLWSQMASNQHPSVSHPNA